MSNKSVIFVALVALLAIAGVAFLTGEDDGGDGHGALFPDLDVDAINRVSAITLRAAGGAEVHLVRGERDVWQVADKDGYPADRVKIRNLLLALSEARRIERMTSMPEQYEQLGVAGPKEGGGLLVTLADAQRSWEVIIGTPSSQLSDGQFVRIADEEASWLINRRFFVETEARTWLDTRIIHMEPADLYRATIAKPGGETLEVVRQSRGQELTLAALGEDYELKDPGALNRIAATVDFLDFNEVYVKNDDFTLPDDALTAIFTTFDGLQVALRVYRIGETPYAAVGARADDQIMEQFAVADEKRAEIAAEAQSLDEHFSRWYYRLHDAVYEPLTASTATLTRKKAP